MRRVLAMVLTLIVLGSWAVAQNGHFISATTSCGTTTATVSFKESGLGTQFSSVNIAAAGNSTAVYQCFNGGGNHPKAGNKETVNGPVQASGTFNVGHNGTVTGSLTLTAPGPGGFTCPGGQNLVLVSATFSDISLTDSTSGATATPTPNSCQ